MTDLSELAAALRKRHDGASPAPNATRARVLAELERRRRAQRKRWFAMIPLLAVLGGSTAWAAASGELPSFVERAADLLGVASGPSSVGADPNPASARTGSGPPALPRTDESLADEPLAPGPPSDESATEASNAGELPAAGSIVDASPEQARAGEARAAVAEEPRRTDEGVAAASGRGERVAAELPGEEGLGATGTGSAERLDHLASYRAAHDAHFKSGDCGVAERGYAAYLRAAPNGTLAVEARYNRALCLLRLGRSAEARPLLQPFAAGAHGDYRRSEARRLLDAIGP